MKILKKTGNKNHIRHGSYSLAWTGALIAVIVVINLIAGELPSRFTSKDMTAGGYYSLTEQSKEMIRGLSEEVTIYELTNGSESDAMLEKLLEQYEGYSGNIRVVKKDIVKYPTFASDYTEETLEPGSLIVECGEKSRVIANSDIYEYSYNSYYQMQQTGFDGEGQITSAVANVTSDDLPKIYVLEGHKEGALSEELKSRIEKENIEMDSLSLVSAGTVPEDAKALIMDSPTKDFSDEETAAILDYLKSGGRAFITSSYTGEDMTNFRSILEYYGVSPINGIVVEGDGNYYHPQSPLYLLPEIQPGEVTASLTEANRRVFMPVSQGIETLDSLRDGVEITSLLKTSGDSYNKADPDNMTTVEKEKGDREGPFDLGVMITGKGETAENDEETAETKIFYLASGYFMEEQMDNTVSGANYELVMNCLSSLTDQGTSVSIPAKSLEVTYLTMTAAAVSWWSIFLTAVLPVSLIAAGGAVWYKRRKR